MKEYSAPQLVKVEINASEAFATYENCTVDYGNTQGATGCCESGSGPLMNKPSTVGCSQNLVKP